MIFRLTLKAQEQINISNIKMVKSNNEKEFFKEWNINIVHIGHKKYFMLTECKTLFTILKHAKGIKSKEQFEAFIGYVFANIFNELIEGMNLKTLNINNCSYSNTENDYVRRAQIDHLYHAKILVEEGRNTFDINRFPIASIGFKFPVDYFIEELSKIIEKDGAIFIENNLLN